MTRHQGSRWTPRISQLRPLSDLRSSILGMMEASRDSGARNRKGYREESVVEHYRGRTDLFPGEAEFLRRYVRDGCSLLDMGVGAGRTTAHLAGRTDYVAIDWAPEMVRAAREAHPGVRIDVGDATDLAFADESFDVVLFSFNGIDCVDLVGRRRVYSEALRVLRPGGVFVFSSHNPRFVHLRPIDHRPRVLAGWVRRFAIAAPAALSAPRFCDGAGFFEDPVDIGMRYYSATPARIRAELCSSGFVPLAVQPDRCSTALVTPWYDYAARKP